MLRWHAGTARKGSASLAYQPTSCNNPIRLAGGTSEPSGEMSGSYLLGKSDTGSNVGRMPRACRGGPCCGPESLGMCGR
jgi:hypothetical protein